MTSLRQLFKKSHPEIWRQLSEELGARYVAGSTWKGERIYHLPWSPWYTKVRMDDATFQRKGKRWFCSETEAQNAGWRPSATR